MCLFDMRALWPLLLLTCVDARFALDADDGAQCQYQRLLIERAVGAERWRSLQQRTTMPSSDRESLLCVYDIAYRHVVDYYYTTS